MSLLARWNASTHRGLSFALLAMIGAGLFSFPYQQAIQEASLLASVYGVFVWALAFSLPGALKTGRETRLNWFTGGHAVVIALLGVLGNYAVCAALEGSAPTLVMVITRSEIVIAMVLGWGILKELVSKQVWSAVGVILFGILLMRYESLSDSIASWAMVFWALTAAFSFASIQVLSKRIIHQVDPLALNVIRLIIALGLMSVFPGMLSEVREMSGHAWMLLGLAAFFGPFIGRVSYTYALRDLTIARAMTIGTCAPVLTLLIDALVFDRVPSWLELLGGAVVLFGVLASFLRIPFFETHAAR